MDVDFRDAAMRHWEDAELLKQEKRAANADQLYGLAAECALKGAMAALGAATTMRGDLTERSHRVHIEALWDEFQAFAAERKGGRCVSALKSFAENPFADWSVEQRYAATAAAPSGATLHQHRRAATCCRTALQRTEAF